MTKRRRIGQAEPYLPPAVAAALVAFCSPRPQRDSIVGDLQEEFRLLARDDLNAAKRWYCDQVTRSVGPLMLSRMISSSMIRTAASVVVGSLAAATGAILFGGLLQVWISPIGAPRFPQLTLVVTLCALVSSTCGGWATSSVTGDRTGPVFLPVGLIVVAPDVAHTFLDRDATPFPWSLMPLGLAVLATISGLYLGSRLWAEAGNRITTPGETPTP